MTIDELKLLLPDFKALQPKLVEMAKDDKVIKAAKKQYDPTAHDIFDTSKRPDKTFKDDDERESIVRVTRLAVPFQKQIVSRAAQFLCGNPIELSATTDDEQKKVLLEAVKKVWEDNKLDYKSKQLAKLMMSETEAAELWYVEELSPEEKEDYWEGKLKASFKLRMRILANSLGDSLYPVFDATGDMIAFGRGYKIGDKDEYLDVYTQDKIFKGVKTGGADWVVDEKPNLYKKIPVIYYSQDDVEWKDVQSMIDRFEVQLSNHADVNDYFGSPLVAVTGKVLSFSKKGETGKLLELEQNSKVEYITWDQAPASVKLEMETLLKLIFDGSDTPIISFEQMKGLGVFSGIALKMLFLAAHMKASDKVEIFGESIQRRINFIKSIIGQIDTSISKVKLTIKPKFEFFLPKNDMEKIEAITQSVTSKIISKKTAISLNPLVEDAVAEEVIIGDESKGSLDDAFNE